MRILVSYRGIPQSPGWSTGDMVVKAFRALGHKVFPYAKYYQENRWVDERPPLDRYDWDLILVLECNDGEPQYPELRITRARKKACWLFDTSYHEDRYTLFAKYFGFDYHFLANPLTVQEYKVWEFSNVHYLPYACDRDLHGRSLERPKTRDVVLVGSIRDDRLKLARELSILGVDLELIGDVFREDYIDALASAKIVVNQNPMEGRGLLNMRFWEAQAAGAYVLTEREDLSLNAEFITPCIAGSYKGPRDLASQCNSLLCEQDLNQIMTNALIHSSQKYAFEHHTYQNRCETILDTIFPHERN